ncbi:MAG: HAD-IA family hydrolase [Nanoarchaeota archaeon]|nr:HAD-IA family hydrolase [Nanoarchaeota archaeon]
MKVIFLDIGGVICKDIEKHMMKDIAKEYNLDYDDVMKVRSKWWKLFAMDKISEVEYWEGFLKEVGVNESVDKFIQLPYKYIQIMPGAMEFISKLYCKKFIVSDHARPWWKFADEKFKISEHFEEQFLSFEIGSLKENGELLKKAIEKANVLPSEILFIDNSRENLEEGKKLGLNVLLFGD